MRLALVLGVTLTTATATAAAGPAIHIDGQPFFANGLLLDGAFPGEQQFGGFGITNPGTTALTVTDMAFSGPGATLIAFSSDPPCDSGTDCVKTFTVPPGGQQFFSVTCLATQPGVFAATLTVTSNALSGTNTIALPCKGFFPPVIEISPPGGLDFGTQHSYWDGDSRGPACATAPGSQTLTITNTAPEPSEADLTLAFVNGGTTDFTVNDDWGPLDQPFAVASGQPSQATFTYHPTSPDTHEYGDTTLTASYPASLAPITVPFHAHPGSGSLGYTNVIDVGTGVFGQTFTASFVTPNIGDSCLDLYEGYFMSIGLPQALELISPQLSLQNQRLVQAGDAVTWQVSCTPQVDAEPCSFFQVTPLYDDPEEGWSFQVCCTGVDHALSAPDSAAFPDTYRHPTAPTTQVVTIHNQTSSSIDLSAIAVDGTGFSLVGSTTATIAAMGSLDVTVAFEPPSIGDFTGHLVAGEASVALTGKGIMRDLAVSAMTIDLGDVTVGTTATGDPITIHNSSATATFTLSSVALTGDPAFQLTGPDHMTLGPGDTAALQIGVAPTDAGALAAQIQIFADGDPDPLAQISVSATAVDGDHHGGGCSTGSAAGWPIALALLALRRRRQN